MQTLSAIKPIRKRPRPTARCKGSQDKQTSPCATGIIANGFLRHHFLPVFEPSPYLPEQSKVESSIFNIAEKYFGLL